MSLYWGKIRHKLAYRVLSAVVMTAFVAGVVLPPPAGYAQTVLNLPAPGDMVPVTTAFAPAMIKGINLYPDNPRKFDFLIDKGDTDLEGAALEAEATKLIKYFMASLTVPEDEMWVNLSPYEHDRIIPQNFGRTEMGRDLLAQDYVLKQLSASLMYPEDELGKTFWDRVYKKAYEQFGTTEIPMNTFNKIWIVPKEAKVYEHARGAFVVSSHLNVMLEEDYLALESNVGSTKHGMGNVTREEIDVISGVSSQVVREVLIPEIEREVNEGKTFANLRQIYHAMILAVWYKRALKDSLLGKVYVDHNKTQGVDVPDGPAVTEKIYNQYLEAFKEGVYNYIKEDYDPATQAAIPRKYFSGGALPYTTKEVKTTNQETGADIPPGRGVEVTTTINPLGTEAQGKSLGTVPAAPVKVEDTIFERRMSGQSLHPAALPSDRGRKKGSIWGDEARYYVAYLEATGQSVWDIPAAGPADGSSYDAPRSPFAGDELLIDPDFLVDQDLLPQEFLNQLDEQGLSDREFTEQFLDKAYEMYQDRRKEVRRTQDNPDAEFEDEFLNILHPIYRVGHFDEFEAYKTTNAAWLEDYALFTAIEKTQKQGAPWWQWRKEYKYQFLYPHQIEQFKKLNRETIDRIKFGQFIYDWQWGELKDYANRHEVQLLGHMSMFVPYNSAVVWAHPEWFDLNADGTPRIVASVTPEGTIATAQRGGSPQDQGKAIDEDKGRFWQDLLRLRLESFDFVSVDGARGSDAHWRSLPASDDAGKDRLEKSPGTALLRALQTEFAKEEFRKKYHNKFPFIAGDSGPRDDGVRALRDTFHLPGMTIIGTDGDMGHVPDGAEVNTVSYDDGPQDAPMSWAMIARSLNSPAALSIISTRGMIGGDRAAQMTAEEFERLWQERSPGELGLLTEMTGRAPSLKPEAQMVQNVNSGDRYDVDMSFGPAGELQYQFRDRNTGASFTVSTEGGLRISSYIGRDGQEVMHSPMFFGYPLGRVEGHAYEWRGNRASLDGVKDEYQGYKLHPGKDLPVEVEDIRQTEGGVIFDVSLDTRTTDQIAGKAIIRQSIMLTTEGALVVMPTTENTGNKPVPHLYGAHNWVRRSADSALQFTTGAPVSVFAAGDNKIATKKVATPPSISFEHAVRIEDVGAALDHTFTDLPTDDKGFWEVVVWNASGPGRHVSFRGDTPAVHIWTEWGGNISVEGVTVEQGALGRQHMEDTLFSEVPVGERAQNILIMQSFADKDVEQTKLQLAQLEDHLLSAAGEWQEAAQPENPGGIDLNPNEMDMQLDGESPVSIPAAPGMLEQLQEMNIDGFVPAIMHVAPITNLPALLGLTDGEDKPYANGESQAAAPSTDLGLIDKFRKPGMGANGDTDDHLTIMVSAHHLPSS